jgi:hypothetical protein
MPRSGLRGVRIRISEGMEGRQEDMENGKDHSEVERLDVIGQALVARAVELEQCKRLPRGYDLARLRRESEILRREARRVAEDMALEARRRLTPQEAPADVTGGVGA